MHKPGIHRLRLLTSHDYFPVLLLLGLGLLIGALTVSDYGESWDEQLRYNYASKSLAAYLGDLRTLKDEKGPFYVMLAKAGSEVLNAVGFGRAPIDSWHFMHFLSFLLSVFFLYAIGLSITNKLGATGGALLFATQPLLWGHAFINPKDVPFMAFFLGAVALGIRMGVSMQQDHSLDAPAHAQDEHGWWSRLSSDWRSVGKTKRFTSALLSGLSLIMLLSLILGARLVRQWITLLVQRAYSADPASLLGAVFSRLAANRQDLPVENYVQKALKVYPGLLLLLVLAVLLLHLLLAWRLFPATSRSVWRDHLKPYLRLIGLHLTRRPLLLAGIFLGLSASIRSLGPAAGLLIAGYSLVRFRRKALPALVAYFLVAAVVTYATWPALWGDPVRNYLQSFSQASNYDWEGKVMFQGVDYGVGDLPRTYLPALLLAQFTEPALLLFAAGIILAVSKFLRKQLSGELLALLAAWLFVPVLAAVLFQPTLYDNFRHFLFIVPPIFLFSAFGLGVLFDYLRKPLISALVLAALLLPNLYWDISLHPYQYVYYNLFTGGIRGAFRSYEMDYWATSYREAVDYLNRIAPQNASIVVWGPDHVVRNYIRPDLVVYEYRREYRDDPKPVDFAILSTRHNKDETLFPDAHQIFQVGRKGALYVVVKQLGR